MAVQSLYNDNNYTAALAAGTLASSDKSRVDVHAWLIAAVKCPLRDMTQARDSPPVGLASLGWLDNKELGSAKRTLIWRAPTFVPKIVAVKIRMPNAIATSSLLPEANTH